MFLFKLYFLKALKRLKLLKSFNFFFNISLNSIKVRIPFINGIGLSNFILEEDWLDDLIGGLISNEEGCFIDIGANIGQSLIRVRIKKPNLKYIGFEPSASCVSYLQHLISMNKFQSCIIYNCALSLKTQSLTLEKSSDEDPRASVVPGLRPDFFTDHENVLSLDFDTYFPDEIITFVKIDVEGAELDVIIGMKNSILHHRPIITCEVLDSFHHSVFEYTQSRASELSELIHSLDYSIIRLQTDKLNQKIISYKIIESITLKQWTTESYNDNDYLLCPYHMQNQVLNSLEILCNRVFVIQ